METRTPNRAQVWNRNNLLIILLLLWIALYEWINNKTIFTIGVLVVLVIAIYLYAVNRFAGLMKSRKAFNAVLLEYEPYPNPAKSMTRCFENAGYSLSKIDHLLLMSCDVSNEYAQRFVEDVRNSNPKVRCVICGGKDEQMTDFDKIPHVQYIVKDGSVYEHTNIIKTVDGSVFVWYEPEHSVAKDGSHKLPKGAFFMQGDQTAIDFYFGQCKLANAV